MWNEIDKYTKENRDQLDVDRPSDDLWGKLSAELDAAQPATDDSEVGQQSKGPSWLRIAAVLVLGVGIGWAVFNFWPDGVQTDVPATASIEEMYPELAQTESFYFANMQNIKSQITLVSGGGEAETEVKQSFEEEMTQLVTTYNDLKILLQQDINNEQIIDEMIVTLQMQQQLMNEQLSILQRLRERTKKQDNESINI